MSELALKLITENKRTRAKSLDLRNCGLTEIPDEVGELVWLKYLYLSSDEETENMFIDRNSKKTYENNIQTLANIQKQNKKNLLLKGDSFRNVNTKKIIKPNDIRVLNKEVNKLKKLKRLYLDGNTNLEDLTPLSTLILLEELDISNTGINNLNSVSNLTNLQKLDISGTPISDLTPLFFLILNKIPVYFSNERRIFLENSKKHDNHYYWVIKKGQKEPLRKKTIGIYIKDSPTVITNPPESILSQGNEAILNYFQEQQIQGTDYLYEAKLLIVGAGSAGKTSLIRRLYQPSEPLPEEHETTKGIDIYQHKFTVQDSRYPNGREFRLNVWDFAGQEQYRPADTFFFTQRSLYVLLDDTRNDDKTVQDACFKYWLEAVDCFSDNSPVLIFQNEKGGRSKAIDLAGIKAKFENVKERYSGNLEHKNAVDKVREAIEFYAKQLPHIGEELPAKWISIRAEIEQAAKQQATISQQDYFNLYEKHLPFDREKALHLSQYLHDLGVFLHFQKDNLLKRVVILQNQWATEAVFKILDDETVKNHQHGRFTEEDCQRLWQDSDYADMHPELLALMEKFELCYLLQDSNPKKWLVPQLLPPSKPIELNDWAKAGDLVLRYRYEFLPKGLINRLMVRKHYYVPRPELAWLTGVLFERNGTQVLVELSAQGNEIVFRARGIERKELLSIIAADLEALNATFKGLAEKVAVLIPCCCGECKIKSIPATFERNKLLEKLEKSRNETYCPDSDESVEIKQLLDGVQITKGGNMKKIFISYSKHDNDYKVTLIKHLASLRDKIVTWNDRDLLAGEEWDKRIKEELYKADIVLYLVSSDSLATDYIQQIELPLIEQYCNEGKCKFVPVIIRACDWKEQGFAKYTVLPEKGKHIKSWADEDEAWLSVVQGIKRIIALPI